MKVAILTNIPAPYRVSLFHHAQEHFSSMRVLFQSEMDADRPWEVRPDLSFDHAYLSEATLKVGGRTLRWNRGLGASLVKYKPDAVVAFGFSLGAFHCSRVSAGIGASFVSLNDGTAFTDPVRGMEARYRRWLLRDARGAIAASSLAASYYHLLGMKKDRVKVVELTTDLIRIRKDAAEPARRLAARKRWQLEGPTVCFVGRLIYTKRILDACEAFVRVKCRVPGAQLVIVGDGPERNAIATWVAQHGGDSIKLIGAVPPAEVVDVYAASDVLVFPATRERFGMVVIEALAAGKPVVSTRTCGAGIDLIRDGENGYLVDERDVGGMERALVKALTKPSFRCGEEFSAQVVAAHDVRVEAARFGEAVKELAGQKDGVARAS